MISQIESQFICSRANNGSCSGLGSDFLGFGDISNILPLPAAAGSPIFISLEIPKAKQKQKEMGHRLKISIALTILCISAISLYLTVEHQKRRKRRASKTPCYLSSEFKPQSSFKRLLADNSYSPFKHFKPSHHCTNGTHTFKHFFSLYKLR